MPLCTLPFSILFNTAPHDIVHIFDDWRQDSLDFLRYTAPRILAIIVVSFILARLLKIASRHLADLSSKQVLPSALRTQQLRTLSSVIYSVGVFIIAFLAVMQILTQLNIKVEPLLASAGIAGLAIGFGRKRWSRTSSTASPSWSKTSSTSATLSRSPAFRAWSKE